MTCCAALPAASSVSASGHGSGRTGAIVFGVMAQTSDSSPHCHGRAEETYPRPGFMIRFRKAIYGFSERISALPYRFFVFSGDHSRFITVFFCKEDLRCNSQPERLRLSHESKVSVI
jgi:hypothetical protein